MRKIILLLIFLISLSCSKAQDNQQKIWSGIVYSFSSGPLPPKYQYKYSVVLNEDNSCAFSYLFGINDTAKPETKSFTIVDVNKDSLTSLINETGLLEGKIISLPEHKHPIGGSLKSVTVVMKQTNPNLDQPPPVYVAPYFPVEEYKIKLEKLYDYIYSLVPQEYRDEMNSKRDEFINKN